MCVWSSGWCGAILLFFGVWFVFLLIFVVVFAWRWALVGGLLVLGCMNSYVTWLGLLDGWFGCVGYWIVDVFAAWLIKMFWRTLIFVVVLGELVWVCGSVFLVGCFVGWGGGLFGLVGVGIV